MRRVRAAPEVRCRRARLRPHIGQSAPQDARLGPYHRCPGDDPTRGFAPAETRREMPLLSEPVPSDVVPPRAASVSGSTTASPASAPPASMAHDAEDDEPPAATGIFAWWAAAAPWLMGGVVVVA